MLRLQTDWVCETRRQQSCVNLQARFSNDRCEEIGNTKVMKVHLPSHHTGMLC